MDYNIQAEKVNSLFLGYSVTRKDTSSYVKRPFHDDRYISGVVT